MHWISRCLQLCLVATLLPAVLQAQSKPNALTEKEVAEGWILLWDGETTFGWESHGKAEWKTSDGIISASSGDNGWLGTTTPFGDFVLKADFRTGPDGNSGIFLRAASEGEPHKTGYELQIFDEHKEYKTGSLVNYLKAKAVRTTPNQWHTFEVRATGDLFVVKLDRKTLLNARDKSHSVGHIGLQYNKDKKIEFRNLKLKPLGLNPIFNGKDLTGWKKVNSPDLSRGTPEWSVRNGISTSSGGPVRSRLSKPFRISFSNSISVPIRVIATTIRTVESSSAAIRAVTGLATNLRFATSTKMRTAPSPSISVPAASIITSQPEESFPVTANSLARPLPPMAGTSPSGLMASR